MNDSCSSYGNSNNNSSRWSRWWLLSSHWSLMPWWRHWDCATNQRYHIRLSWLVDSPQSMSLLQDKHLYRSSFLQPTALPLNAVYRRPEWERLERKHRQRMENRIPTRWILGHQLCHHWCKYGTKRYADQVHLLKLLHWPGHHIYWPCGEDKISA